MGEVISLLRARQRFRARIQRRQWHPISGHMATVIPFPLKVRPEVFAKDARNVFNGRTNGRRHLTKPACPVPDCGPSHPSCLSHGVDRAASSPEGMISDPGL